MTQSELASLSFAELRDRLKARIEQPDSSNGVNLREALRYLTALPDAHHTEQSVDALLQLARNFVHGARPAESLQAASHAARLAALMGQKLLLCASRGVEGVALSDIGRFAESTVAQVESWSLAHDLRDKKREIWAMVNIGVTCAGTGQWNVAIRYFTRVRELAEEHRFPYIELQARNNLAVCAIELREPDFGLRALSQLCADAPQTTEHVTLSAIAHNNLAHLHALVGDLSTARDYADRAIRLARIARAEKTIRSTAAVLGLIDVRSGAVEKGLTAVDRALTLAKRVQQIDVPDFLGICIDAHEAAGHSDVALEYLRELVEWKRKSIDAIPLHWESIAESVEQLQTGVSYFDEGLVAKAHSLNIAIRDCIQRLVETAINAEMASGYDLYRTFRVAKLTKYVATAIGWDEERVALLALEAQLCNIGMVAIPTRVVLKPSALSEGEQHLVRDHTRFGAELLRKSKLRILNVSSDVAEQHHERYDGSGYPRGLSGEAITEEARIVAICETFDAMTHPRPWRPVPLSIHAALSELKHGSGTQFDPSFVNVFIDLAQREFEEHKDLDALLAEGADQLEYVRARARMETLLREGN